MADVAKEHSDPISCEIDFDHLFTSHDLLVNLADETWKLLEQFEKIAPKKQKRNQNMVKQLKSLPGENSITAMMEMFFL